MKKILLSISLLFSTLTVCSQNEIVVVDFNQSTKDISARTNQRDDTKGIPCALIKVQFPLRDVLFDGDIAGEVVFKTNEYWVYMPEKSSRLEVKAGSCKPLIVDFAKHGIPSVESKGTYELCLLKKEKEASQLYNDGMVALAKNDIVTAFDNLQKASDSGYAPATYQLGQASLVPFDRYDEGDPNYPDSYQEAYKCFKKAADVGHPQAQYALAKMLLDYKEGKDFENKYGDKWSTNITGIKVEQNYLDNNFIWNLIEKSANEGDVDAQWMMISDEKWCEDNSTKGLAVAEFGMGIRFDDELSTYEYPMLESLEINRSKDYNTAFNWYQKAANHGLDAAQWRLGEMYARGLGVEENINKALTLRTQAAEQGYYLYQFMMGIMYAFGAFSDYSSFMFQDGFHYEAKIQSNLQQADYWLRKFSHKQLAKSEKKAIDMNGKFAFTLDELASKLKSEGKWENAIYWYQREMELGYRDAYCNLGEMYLKGMGITKDYEKARKLFEESDADDNHFGDGYSGSLREKAKCFLGIIYRDGLGVSKNLDKAKEYFMASYGKNENSMAQYELGILYKQDGNYEEARSILFRGSVTDDVKTYVDGEDRFVRIDEYYTKILYERGLMNYEGLGGEKNVKKAIEQFTEAASRGSEDAKQKLKGVTSEDIVTKWKNYYHQKKYTEAIKWLKIAAEQGDEVAQVYLGDMYEKGLGVSQDYSEAIKWYRLSAEQGYHDAQNCLGMMYKNGLGVSKDYIEAIKWFKKSAEQGNIGGQYNLAAMFFEGKGVNKDYIEAIKWFRKSAEQGFSDSQLILGYMYEEGLGVGRNNSEAKKWYKKAAEQGDKDAQKALTRFP